MSGFQEFYDLYGNKTGRKDAEKAWNKLKPDMFLTKKIMDHLRGFLDERQAKKARGEWVPELPYPATWLNGRRWEDVGVRTPTDAGAVPDVGLRVPDRPDWRNFEPPTDEERKEGLKLLAALKATLTSRFDMKEKLRWHNQEQKRKEEERRALILKQLKEG